MSIFTIDEDKCTHCGICVHACPTQVIECISKEALPSLILGAAPFCIECGHCVTICPTRALTHKAIDPDDCDIIDKKLIPEAKNIAQFLKSRRSIRAFKDKPVDRETLTDLIDLARYAPTGSNKQEVHWTVFDDKNKIKDLSALVIDWAGQMAKIIPDEISARKMERLTEAWALGKDKILNDTPALILVHGQEDLPLIQTDCIIALTYLELYAASKGLGTCWGGYFTGAANFHKPLIDKLDLTQNHKCFGAIMIGYPLYKYKLIPKRKPSNIIWG